MNELIDLYLKGEYDVQKLKAISDNEYYFENKEYFNGTIIIINKKG